MSFRAALLKIKLACTIPVQDLPTAYVNVISTVSISFSGIFMMSYSLFLRESCSQGEDKLCNGVVLLTFHSHFPQMIHVKIIEHRVTIIKITLSYWRRNTRTISPAFFFLEKYWFNHSQKISSFIPKIEKLFCDNPAWHFVGHKVLVFHLLLFWTDWTSSAEFGFLSCFCNKNEGEGFFFYF